jgi:hypothetical protein
VAVSKNSPELAGRRGFKGGFGRGFSIWFAPVRAGLLEACKTAETARYTAAESVVEMALSPEERAQIEAWLRELASEMETLSRRIGLLSRVVRQETDGLPEERHPPDHAPGR